MEEPDWEDCTTAASKEDLFGGNGQIYHKRNKLHRRKIGGLEKRHFGKGNRRPILSKKMICAMWGWG